MKNAALELDVTFARGGFTLATGGTLNGGITGLTGSSGSGKSTLLRVLAGLEPDARGKIAFGDAVWQDSTTGRWTAPEKRQLSYVPQDSLLFPHLRVKQQITAARSVIGSDQMAELVQMLDLGGLLGAHSTELSGGETQRVALARALGAGPRLLLLDEPLSAVDPHRRSNIWQALRAWLKRHDILTFWVSHDAVELQSCAANTWVLRGGQIADAGNTHEVLANASLSEISGPGFDNVLPALNRPVTGSESTLALGLDGEGPELTLSGPVAPTARQVLLVIPARSIVITSQSPGNTSARNVLEATVESMHTLGDRVMVQVSTLKGGQRLRVEVTRSAVGDLELSCAQRVFLLIKSTSLRIP